MLIGAFARAAGQLTEGALLRPALLGVLAAAAVFGALATVGGWGLAALAGGAGWLAGVVGALGGTGALLLAWWLFVPAAIALASLFLNPVAAAVERRHYPGLPLPRGAGAAGQLGYALRVGAVLGALSLLALLLTVTLPPVGAAIFFVINAWALGPALFESLAQRRLPVAEARQGRRARRWRVLLAGGALSALALVPVLNLLVPAYGAAVMTHLLHGTPGRG